MSFEWNKITINKSMSKPRSKCQTLSSPLCVPKVAPLYLQMRYCRQGSLQSNNFELEEAKENLQVLFEQNPDMREQVLKVLEPQFGLQSDLETQLKKDKSKLAKKIAKKKKMEEIDSILKCKVDAEPWNPEVKVVAD